MRKRILKNNKGFTLVEMLVSIALFAIVLVVVLSSILTVVDVSKKSHSLTILMNDMNFVFENITRSVKTGEVEQIQSDRYELYVTEDLGGDIREIKYYFKKEGDIGRIMKEIKVNNVLKSDVAITSENINIDYDKSKFTIYAGDAENRQPRVLISIQGTVKLSEKISSAFSMQTTVSQRNYDLTQLAP